MSSKNFGPDSTNPRDRRAYAHAMISGYQRGEVSWEEAFAAAYAASGSAKGSESGFGNAVGDVTVDAYALCFETNETVVSALSPALKEAVDAMRATGEPFGFRLDAFMTRPGTNDSDLKLQSVIEDPIAEGFKPIDR